MFENIVIICKEEVNACALDILNKIKKILQGKNISIVELSEIKKEDFAGADLVITLGGDGTFIKASHFLNNTPIIGINTEPEESEGALTSIDKKEIDKLKDIIDGKHKIIIRERAKVVLNGKVIDEHALNDVYVGSATQFHTSRYVIKFKEKEEEQRSSGVVISTGSGSPAWYKSAGGKPFNPEEKVLKFIVRELYSGRVYKPVIFSGEVREGEKIFFESKRSEGGMIAIDSIKPYFFNFPAKIHVELSNCPLNVLMPSF